MSYSMHKFVIGYFLEFGPSASAGEFKESALEKGFSLIRHSVAIHFDKA
jgi:hypothetical protein